MNTTQHTQGPWHIESVAINGMQSRISICGSDGSLVTNARASDADLKLIAAAPDLLAALEAHMLLVPGYSQGARSFGENSLYDLSVKAIAKAKGE